MGGTAMPVTIPSKEWIDRSMKHYYNDDEVDIVLFYTTK